MRIVAVSIAVALSLSCATGSIGTSVSLWGDQDQLWLAAQRAIREMGGRIVHADRATGTVAGRLDVEGTPIDLNVSITGSPAPESTADGPWDITVRASVVGDTAPGEEWQRRLEFLSDELMDRITAASTGSVRALPQ